MIQFLVKKFIKNYQNTSDKIVREKYGILGGILGVICNIFLFILKITIGLLTASVAILSDGFNNLSDCGSSIISIFSAKLSNKKPDKEHPFGHGRLEYICSLIVSFIIIFVGLQLLLTSANKVIHKEVNLEFQPVLLGILGFSILIKIWMFSYNRYLGKQIQSMVLKAASIDSLGDVIITSVVVISTVVNYYLFPSFPLDSVMGILVSLLIIWNGIQLTLSTCNTLLGTPPSEEMIQSLTRLLLHDNRILGIHDLIIHDYGPGRKLASVHAEVSDQANLIETHELIDRLEKEIEAELSIHMVIHMDPISIDDPEVLLIKNYLGDIIQILNKDLSFHDLRITKGEDNVNVIFDLVVPYGISNKEISELMQVIGNKIHDLNSKYSCVINIDYK